MHTCVLITTQPIYFIPSYLVWGNWTSNADCNAPCESSGIETFTRVCLAGVCTRRLDGTKTTSADPNETIQESCVNTNDCPGDNLCHFTAVSTQ